MNLLENKPESSVAGTIGIGPLREMKASGSCELRKCSLLSEIRGLGLGQFTTNLAKRSPATGLRNI